jgi:hypothetical protein
MLGYDAMWSLYVDANISEEPSNYFWWVEVFYPEDENEQVLTQKTAL